MPVPLLLCQLLYYRLLCRFLYRFVVCPISLSVALLSVALSLSIQRYRFVVIKTANGPLARRQADLSLCLHVHSMLISISQPTSKSNRSNIHACARLAQLAPYNRLLYYRFFCRYVVCLISLSAALLSVAMSLSIKRYRFVVCSIGGL
jgi:hypothetical protein